MGKFVPLLLANFTRHKLRTLLTIFSIVIAFLLFCYLAAISKAFELGISIADADRLITRDKVSLLRLLPASYEGRIEKIGGVTDATHATWLGGIYKEPRNMFPQVAVKPEEFLRMYPRFIVKPEQLKALLNTRTGTIVGRTTADRFGWNVGDRVPLQATFWFPKNGNTWIFDIVGIYEGADGVDKSLFIFRYDYLEENKHDNRGMVGWYYVRVKDPRNSAAIAKLVDQEFENSPYETKTETEAAFISGVSSQIGNIALILQVILAAVFFTLLLVTANTMAQSVRERISELGLMKAIGFSDGDVLSLVLAESFAIAVVGGGLGLFLGWFAVASGDPTKGYLSMWFMPPASLVTGFALVLLLGLLAGLIPAIQAMRLNTVDALRRE